MAEQVKVNCYIKNLYNDLKKVVAHYFFLSIAYLISDLFVNYNLLYNIVLNSKNNYEEGMNKLVHAENTSNIEISFDELRKQNKKRRREKAKKIMSSSDEDISFNEDENNNAKQICTKSLSACPEIENYVSQKGLL